MAGCFFGVVMWRHSRPEESTRENIFMSLLDSIVGRCFRDEKAGRVVVFVGNRRHRGYVVKSEAEELKIRSFLRMFCFASLSILLLGYVLAFESSMQLNYALGRPARHLLRTGAITFGIFFLVQGLPYLLLLRSYKKAFLNFVSAQDEVAVSEQGASRRPWIAAGLIASGILILLGAIYFVSAK